MCRVGRSVSTVAGDEPLRFVGCPTLLEFTPMKKILALAVVTSVVALSVGCGGSTSGGSMTKTVSSTTTVSSATTPK